MSDKTCDRCGADYQPGTSGWSARFLGGYLDHVICPDCQTPAEQAEFASTPVYTATPDGRGHHWRKQLLAPENAA